MHAVKIKRLKVERAGDPGCLDRKADLPRIPSCSLAYHLHLRALSCAVAICDPQGPEPPGALCRSSRLRSILPAKSTYCTTAGYRGQGAHAGRVHQACARRAGAFQSAAEHPPHYNGGTVVRGVQARGWRHKAGVTQLLARWK